MVAGTKRFIFFQTLLLICVLIWIGYLIKTSHITFSIKKWNPMIIIGGFLLSLQLVLVGIKNKSIKDLKIAEFKNITWPQVLATFCIGTMLSLGIVVIMHSINSILATLKTNCGNIVTQVIGGFVSGMVGFIAAIFAYHYQQRNRYADKIKEHIDELYFEITHNMIIVKGDLDTKLPFGRKLENSCWNAAVSAKLPINGKVKGLLLVLYGDFDLYNFGYQGKRDLALRDAVSQSLRDKFNPVKDSFADSLYESIKSANAILFGEMVRLGYRHKKDWAYSDIDWEKIYCEFNEACKKK